MYLKKIKIPYHVQQYEALSRRLTPVVPRTDAESRFKKGMAGYRGERSLDYLLSALPDKKFFIIHNLRLSNGSHYFQIDFLILCPRFFLILEVKNIMGTLIFDTELSQLIRELDQTTDVFDDPISQAENLNVQLIEWLDVHGGSPALPVADRVVIASPARLQVTDLKDLRIKKIVRKSNLTRELMNLNRQCFKKSLDIGSVEKMARTLLLQHQPRIIDLFSFSSVRRSDIIRGVQCPDCGFFPMKRENGIWHCTSCGHVSKTAHIAAFRDYFLIFGPVITNRQCRDFLMLESAVIAKKLLQTVSLHYRGEKRTRIYYLSFQLLIDESSDEREAPWDENPV
ncbi:NERD domain-containing protein [Sporolactobacillus sp. KGMB 08714]|uniref:NERD domain-containing protein n=1 Tax=Sporolactobacillus sp. KGMB 08714 TaxID=3064704 RepID=UPI002FBDCCDD